MARTAASASRPRCKNINRSKYQSCTISIYKRAMPFLRNFLLGTIQTLLGQLCGPISRRQPTTIFLKKKKSKIFYIETGTRVRRAQFFATSNWHSCGRCEDSLMGCRGGTLVVVSGEHWSTHVLTWQVHATSVPLFTWSRSAIEPWITSVPPQINSWDKCLRNTLPSSNLRSLWLKPIERNLPISKGQRCSVWSPESAKRIKSQKSKIYRRNF